MPLDLNKIPESNAEWAAQMLVSNLPKSKVSEICRSLVDLDTILYKSWAKDMTLTEFLEMRELIKSK